MCILNIPGIVAHRTPHTIVEDLDAAFELLGPDIALAPAKDLERDGDAGNQAAGTGLLDYERYLSLLHAVGYYTLNEIPGN